MGHAQELSAVSRIYVPYSGVAKIRLILPVLKKDLPRSADK